LGRCYGRARNIEVASVRAETDFVSRANDAPRNDDSAKDDASTACASRRECPRSTCSGAGAAPLRLVGLTRARGAPPRSSRRRAMGTLREAARDRDWQGGVVTILVDLNRARARFSLTMRDSRPPAAMVATFRSADLAKIAPASLPLRDFGHDRVAADAKLVATRYSGKWPRPLRRRRPSQGAVSQPRRSGRGELGGRFPT
jgi:hypothetical protein